VTYFKKRKAMFIYVANWKMNLQFKEALYFARTHYDGLVGLADLPDKKVVICPTFTEIKDLSDMFTDSGVEIGAQDCSMYVSGAYTGQISALSLEDIGCHYCIVGHSERRSYLAETSDDIAKKVARLLEVRINPIVCIGEKSEDYVAGRAKEVIEEQVLPIFGVVKELGSLKVYIAYEPVWAIGTGVVPQKEYVAEIFDHIEKLGKKLLPGVEMRLLYGGSIDDATAPLIKSIASLGGFLIGSASLDFQKFEKIVKL